VEGPVENPGINFFSFFYFIMHYFMKRKKLGLFRNSKSFLFSKKRPPGGREVQPGGA